MYKLSYLQSNHYLPTYLPANPILHISIYGMASHGVV